MAMTNPNCLLHQNQMKNHPKKRPQHQNQSPRTETEENSSEKQQQKKATPGETQSKVSKGVPSTVSLSNSPTKSEIISEHADIAAPATVKNESECQVPPPSPSVSRPAFEDNIVLGVALDESKKTLPIEEGVEPGPGPAHAPAPLEASVGAGHCGNGSSPNVIDRKSQVPGVAANEIS